MQKGCPSELRFSRAARQSLLTLMQERSRQWHWQVPESGDRRNPVER